MTTRRRAEGAGRTPVTLEPVILDPRWRRAVGGPCGFVRRFAEAALKAAKGTGPVSVALASDAQVQTLNASFRDKDKPTNVLSFPGVGGGGDVILALETIRAEARDQGKSLGDHAGHLIVHGILHLFGYDHQMPGEARRMERLERAILARLGVADPYGGAGTRRA
jgi:probable rRNA maturation factor